MQRLIPFVPLLLAGCIPGRQAAVSNDGRVASTTETGTFVNGRGRIGEKATDVAWSPDGRTLAFAGKDGTTLWPLRKKIPNMVQTLSWSPDGKSLAGVVTYNVGVYDLATSKIRETQTIGVPTIGIRWMPDGRVLEVDESGFQVEGLPRVTRANDQATEGTILDAVPQRDGNVVWMEIGKSKSNSGYLQVPVRLGYWNTTTRTATIKQIAKLGAALGEPSSRRVAIPTWIAFAPGGKRYAMAGMIVDADTRVLERLKVLADKEEPTAAERKEFDTLARAARKRSIVVEFDLSGHRTVLWRQQAQAIDGGPTDLAWSSDGKWLGIARRDGTVRVAAGE